MRIKSRCVLFINGEHGAHALLTALSDENSEISAVVLNHNSKQHGVDKVKDICLEHQIKIFEFDKCQIDELVKNLRSLELNFGFSCYFGHKLPEEIISLFPLGIFNLHISLLPLNRGAHPVAWAIKEKTRHGVTIHRVDATLDTGKIVFQEEINFTFSDTGGSLYRKTTEIVKSVITEFWPALRTNSFSEWPQVGASSKHSILELNEITFPDISKIGTLEEHLNLLRARTFAPDDGIHVFVDSKEYIVTINILPVD